MAATGVWWTSAISQFCLLLRAETLSSCSIYFTSLSLKENDSDLGNDYLKLN